ncbi:MAG: GLUG motif-containing protein [Ignavibacteria bacterium]|nr:GLUG motif-containing protein [Ignavibacteria bacterium]
MKKITFIYVLVMFALNVSVVYAGTYSGGTGTSGDPYQIANSTDLSTLSATSGDWGAYFIQTADINASAIGNWSPIGNSSTKFTGSYDGQNHTISSLSVNWPSNNNIGFFGSVNACTIKNLGLTGVYVYGQSIVGGLVGSKDGTSMTIENCYTTGSVTAWFDQVGGLVGYIWYGANITNCYSSASVQGGACGYSGSYTGGLVGFSDAGSGTTISECYSTGGIQGRGYVGGFIGVFSLGEIVNCYSRGSVTGNGSNSEVSGFVDVNSATINNCYSTGSVSGTSIAGFNRSNSGTVNNSFWDTQTSGTSSSSTGTGKTTTEMKIQSTFLNAGWSPSIWYMDAGINDGYPNLTGATPLPVELTSFTATVSENNVTLNWQTATEVNNYGFEIERKVSSLQSSVGSQMQNSWENIGFVEGHGNSNSPKKYSFTHDKPTEGIFRYRLNQIDNDGRCCYSREIEVNVYAIPMEFALYQNYPNPFNPVTTIEFTLAGTGLAKLTIFDILGREVTTLVNKKVEAGIVHQAKFNASNLSSGLYFYRLESSQSTKIMKCMLMK